MVLHPWPILERQAPLAETSYVRVRRQPSPLALMLSWAAGEAPSSVAKKAEWGEKGRKKSPARLYGEALKGGWRSLGVDDREKVGHCCLPFCRYVWDLLERIRARFTRLSSYAKNPQPHQTGAVVQNPQKKKRASKGGGGGGGGEADHFLNLLNMRYQRTRCLWQFEAVANFFLTWKFTSSSVLRHTGTIYPPLPSLTRTYFKVIQICQKQYRWFQPCNLFLGSGGDKIRWKHLILTNTDEAELPTDPWPAPRRQQSRNWLIFPWLVGVVRWADKAQRHINCCSHADNLKFKVGNMTRMALLIALKNLAAWIKAAKPLRTRLLFGCHFTGQRLN